MLWHRFGATMVEWARGYRNLQSVLLMEKVNAALTPQFISHGHTHTVH